VTSYLLTSSGTFISETPLLFTDDLSRLTKGQQQTLNLILISDSKSEITLPPHASHGNVRFL
jgi:hypothetical protein